MAGLEYSSWKRETADQNQSIYGLDQGPTKNQNVTQAMINALIFSPSKAVRNSTMILGAFNILVALAIASSILYDCYRASRRVSDGYKAKKFCISTIHPAEIFPLVLSLGIAVQGLIFLGAQGTGLSSLFTEGCSVTARFVFPGIFLVPYIQVVFGIECAIRSIRKGPFPGRGKYDVSVCLTVIVMMLVFTAIPTFVQPEINFCFASLVWFVTQYGNLGLGLLATCAGLATISGTIIFYRLTTLVSIEQHQRIEASRMVYYLVLAVVSMVFVIPWFVTLTMEEPTLVTSMMASAVLNLHGFMAGILQMFLRVNTATSSLRPKGMPRWSHGRHEIRFWGPNELAFDSHLLQPVSGSRRATSIGSRTSLIEDEKRQNPSINLVRSPTRGNSSEKLGQSAGKVVEKVANMADLIKPEAVILGGEPTRYHHREQSYSPFPPDPKAVPSSSSQEPQPSSNWKIPESRIKDTMAVLFRPSFLQRQTLEPIYLEDGLLAPPPPLFAGNSSRHRRDSSIQTSVTVEIGLRLSHAPTELQCPSPPRSRRASPLLRLQTSLSPIFSRSPLKPSPLNGNTLRSPLSAEQRAARMKTLPPIPRLSTISILPTMQQSSSELSPAVYSPPSGMKRSPSSAKSPPPRPTGASPMWVPKIQDPNRPRGSKSSWI